MTRILRGRTDRQNWKAATEKWVCWICDFDLGHILFQWVIEGGIKLIVRSTEWITTAEAARHLPRMMLVLHCSRQQNTAPI